MILYHGSNVKVRKPIIIESEIGRDFGFAFYLTPIKEQAEKMAKRKCLIAHQGKPIVSVFEWDEKKNDIKYKQFLEPDLDWLNMILICRKYPKSKHGFDIVEGKIADDNVGETVLFVLEGVMRKEDAVERLKYSKINSQIAFCSDEALKHLKFVSSYEVE